MIGTRYDAQFLGSYNLWLQYHPGNIILQQFIQNHIHYDDVNENNTNNTSDNTKHLKSSFNYDSFWSHHPNFAYNIVHHIIDQMRTQYHSRFLQQDYRNGDWRILSHEKEVVDYVMEELLIQSSSYPQRQRMIQQTIHRMMAHYRFGSLRHARYLTQVSQYNLWKLNKRIFGSIDTTFTTRNNNPTIQRVIPITPINQEEDDTRISHSMYQLPSLSIRFHIPSITSKRKMTKSPTRLLGKEELFYNKEYISPGTTVWCYFVDSDSYYPGTVMNVEQVVDHDPNIEVDENLNHRYTYTISFDDGSIESNISDESITLYEPMTEGDDVYGCFSVENEMKMDDCYIGTVLRVMPSGYISIVYEDGDIEWSVPPNRYYTPPYMYHGPF
jgi:hypothetical protein